MVQHILRIVAVLSHILRLILLALHILRIVTGVPCCCCARCACLAKPTAIELIRLVIPKLCKHTAAVRP